MRWTDTLNFEVSTRLAECRTTKADIPMLVNAKWYSMKLAGKDKEGFTKEDALISILELLDCNSQCIDLTIDEYNELKS